MKALVLILGVYALVRLYSYLWGRIIHGKIKLLVYTTPDRPIESEDIEVWTVLENRSWLPIPWIELYQALPKGLSAEGRDAIRYRTYLLPRQIAKRRHLIKCSTRGLYRFGAARIQLGDGIGLRDLVENAETTAEVLVCPRPLTSTEIPVLMSELVGECSLIRWIQEDTSRPVGVRPYVPGDPYKHIHWAATAHTGELMLKQFDTTSETEVYVFINVQFYDPYWFSPQAEVVDYQCRLAAALFLWAEQQGYSYGLVANASGKFVLPAGRLSGHLQSAMSALGALRVYPDCPFAELLSGLKGRIAGSQTLVVMTAYWDEAISLALEGLRAEGHNITILALNLTLEQLPAGIPVFPIGIQTKEGEVPA